MATDLKAFVASLSHDEVIVLKEAIALRTKSPIQKKIKATAENATEVSDLRCTDHGKRYISYCSDCHVPICSKCLEQCLSHNVKPLTEMKELRRNTLKTNIGLLVGSIPKILEHYNEELKGLEEELVEITKTIQNSQIIFSNKKKTLESETGIINGIKRTMEELEPLCITETLKMIVRRQIKELDCFGAMESEFSSVEKRRLELLVERTNLERTMRTNTSMRMLLDVISKITFEDPECNLGDMHFNGLQSLAINVCYNSILMYGGDIGARNSVVPVVLDLEFFKTANNEEPKDYEGISISSPVSCGIPFNRDSAVTAGISSEGILACHTNAGSNLFLYNILTKASVNIHDISGYASSAFYQGKLYLFINGKNEIYHAPVSALFEKPESSTFVKSPYNGCQCQCDVSRSEISGKVYYGAGDKGLYEYDLETMTNKSLGVPNITSVYSTTGVELCEYKCLCTTTNNDTIAVKQNGSTEVVKSTSSYANVFIPSSVEPDAVEKGVIFDTSNMYYKTIKHKLTEPIKPRCYQSILRLMGDIFMIYDEGKKDWVCVKIIVP